MLNYEPNDLTSTAGALTSQEWAVFAWDGEDLPAESLLLNVIAASRKTPIPATPHTAFQPERISGLCAST